MWWKKANSVTPPPSTAKQAELAVTPSQQSTTPQNPGTPITINVNVTPTQNTTTSNSTVNTTQTETKTAVETETKVQSYLKSCTHYTTQLLSQGIAYKYYLAAALGLSFYVYLCYQCTQGNIFLAQDTLWSCFKQELPFEALRTFNKADLTEELLYTLHTRYLTAKDPLNALQPMTLFLQDLETEAKRLHSYQRLYSWIKLLHISSLFPAKATLYDTIDTKLQRLAFIKHLFVSWACQVKLKRHLSDPSV